MSTSAEFPTYLQCAVYQRSRQGLRQRRRGSIIVLVSTWKRGSCCGRDQIEFESAEISLHNFKGIPWSIVHLSRWVTFWQNFRYHLLVLICVIPTHIFLTFSQLIIGLFQDRGTYHCQVDTSSVVTPSSGDYQRNDVFSNKIATRPRRSLSKLRTSQCVLFLFILSAVRQMRLTAICQWRCTRSSGNLRHPLDHNQSRITRLHRMNLGSSSVTQVKWERWHT